MSQVTRGPLPASVYRRRRIAVLLAVLTVASMMVGAVRLVVGGADDEPGQVALSGTSPSAAAGSTPGSATSSDGAEGAAEAGDPASGRDGRRDGKGDSKGKESRRKGGKPAEPALPEPQGACADADVVARPSVEDAVAGRPVSITLTLRTRLAEACTWELSSSSFTWKITSGSDEIWTSRECPRGVPTEELVVRRDHETRTSLTWGGKRSDDECTRFTEWAVPGWYHATVAPLAGEPKDVQFELRAPEPATVTAGPEPRRKRR